MTHFSQWLEKLGIQVGKHMPDTSTLTAKELYSKLAATFQLPLPDLDDPELSNASVLVQAGLVPSGADAEVKGGGLCCTWSNQ